MSIINKIAFLALKFGKICEYYVIKLIKFNRFHQFFLYLFKFGYLNSEDIFQIENVIHS